MNGFFYLPEANWENWGSGQTWSSVSGSPSTSNPADAAAAAAKKAALMARLQAQSLQNAKEAKGSMDLLGSIMSEMKKNWLTIEDFSLALDIVFPSDWLLEKIRQSNWSALRFWTAFLMSCSLHEMLSQFWHLFLPAAKRHGHAEL